MNRIFNSLIIFLILYSCVHVYRQGVEFTASAKGNVQTGEQFRVTFTVNSQPSGFEGPSFVDFRVLSGPNQSTNQSYQLVNGQVSQSFQVSFTYYLQATKEGTFDIQPATVVVNGKKYQSNTLHIIVTRGTTSPATPSTQPGASRQQATQGEGIKKDDVFIRAVIDKANPCQGEQAIITYKIYTTIPISQINITKLSSFPGFWYKNLLNDNDQLKQYNETINGQQYVVADLRKIALFPQRSGEMTIEPMEMGCVAQVKSQRSGRTRDPFFDSFFDDPFFNRNYENAELSLESNAVAMNVKPLPEAGRPLGFAGAVGSFTMDATIDRTELKSNEPLVLKITVSGKGNIELIEAFDISFPPDFETYDPKVTGNINKNASGISGSRTFEYLVIPRNPGDFTVRPVEFSFFDPLKNGYFTLFTPAYNIKVSKGEGESTGISYSGVSQKDIQFIGSDIRHIRTHLFTLNRVNTFFLGSLSFYVWLLIPLILFIGFVIYWKNNQKKRSDIQLVKNRKANKVARKNLAMANEYLQGGKSEEFYIEISRALWGYISNKFNIPLSELSFETVEQRLTGKKVSSATVEEFTRVLNNCEYARFAPGDKSEKMAAIYQEALNIISGIEQELK